MAKPLPTRLQAAYAPCANTLAQQDQPCASNAQDRAAAMTRLHALAEHLGRRAAAQAMRASNPPAPLSPLE